MAVLEMQGSRTSSRGKTIGAVILIILTLAVFSVSALRFLITGSTITTPTIPWPRHGFLFTHIIAGTLVLFLGAYQLWSGLKQRKMTYHPAIGRIYCGGVLLGSIGATFSVVYSHDPFGEERLFVITAPLFASIFAWLVTTAMAFYAIRKRNYEQHKEWMIRSFVLTFFAFAGVRIIGFMILPFVPTNSLGSYAGFMFWVFAVWLPLLGTEVYIQITKIRAKATMTRDFSENAERRMLREAAQG
jgi:uncharacterized membrane protein YozB (DUF420 family)